MLQNSHVFRQCRVNVLAYAVDLIYKTLNYLRIVCLVEYERLLPISRAIPRSFSKELITEDTLERDAWLIALDSVKCAVECL